MVANDPGENKIYNPHRASKMIFRTASQSVLMRNMVNYLYPENRDISHWKLWTIIQKPIKSQLLLLYKLSEIIAGNQMKIH